MEKQLLPEVGKYYHFFDDGKCGPSRHYICKVERLIPFEEAKYIKMWVPDEDDDNKEVEVSLETIWRSEMYGHDWLYAKETDYILEVSCPTYDENLLYAARTKWGGWFTMDIQSGWQGGVVDVDGSKMQNIQDSYEDNPEFCALYAEATEENYLKRNNV